MNRRFLWLLPTAVGFLVVLIGTIRVFSSGARLIGDRAVLALQVADITQGQFPAVGQYSWHGWNHPGAILFYLLTPFEWLARGESWGIFLGISVISTSSVALASWMAFRRRGMSASCFAVVVMVLTWAGADRMTPVDPWTPFIAVTIFVVFMTAVWGVIERDRAALWILIITGALLVQIHVGYVPLVVVIGLTALGLYWWNGGNPRTIVRPLSASVLLFLPWLIHPQRAAGNVGDIASFFISSSDPPAGISRALGTMAFEFSPQASWLRGPAETAVIGEVPSATLWWLFMVMAALLVASVVVYRAAHQDLDHHTVMPRSALSRLWPVTPVIWVSLFIGIVSVSRVQGFLFPYVVVWRLVIALMVLGWIAAVGVVAMQVSRRQVMTLAVVSVVLAGGVALTPISRYDTVTEHVVAVEGAIDQALMYLDQTSEAEPLTLRLKLGDAGLVGLYPAILWELEKRDVDVGIDADTAWVFGERVLPVDEESTVWMVCDSGIGWSLLSSMPGAQIVSLVSPFTEDAESRVAALQIFVAEQLRRAGRVDALTTLDSPLVGLALSELISQGLVDGDAVEELAAFNILTPSPGRRFGIVAFEPEAVPEVWWPLEFL